MCHITSSSFNDIAIWFLVQKTSLLGRLSQVIALPAKPRSSILSSLFYSHRPRRFDLLCLGFFRATRFEVFSFHFLTPRSLTTLLRVKCFTDIQLQWRSFMFSSITFSHLQWLCYSVIVVFICCRLIIFQVKMMLPFCMLKLFILRGNIMNLVLPGNSLTCSWIYYIFFCHKFTKSSRVQFLFFDNLVRLTVFFLSDHSIFMYYFTAWFQRGVSTIVDLSLNPLRIVLIWISYILYISIF